MSPWHYRSSDGMGLLEFLVWCEDLKMQPLLAVYAGTRWRRTTSIPARRSNPTSRMRSTKLSSSAVAPKRSGAPSAPKTVIPPVPLHYIEVGNEDWFDRSARTTAASRSSTTPSKQRYPDLEIIATTP